MSVEKKFAEFVANFEYDALPGKTVRTVQNILLSVLGAGIAGADESGCATIRGYVRDQGGRGEATVFFSGDLRVPARSAAFANGVACRALDYCDAMAPGLHMGSSIVPVALAVAESMGGCSGRDLVVALAVGAEVGARLNLSEAEYHGFDPTGVAGVFAAAATALRLRRARPEQVLHGLALAFNRAGGSFQSNVDGSLAVRTIQGWVAETGITCSDLAGLGITGPVNFLDGIYGYGALFADGVIEGRFDDRLGKRFFLDDTMFKQFPSCGLTQGVTQLALEAVEKHALRSDDVATIEIGLPPYAHRLVGHDFVVGTDPRVNAQFSAQFCVANAILHGSSRLDHFRPEAVTDATIGRLVSKITVVADPALDRRGHTAADVRIATNSGHRIDLALDHPGGFPESPLAQSAHARRFEDCLRYSTITDAQHRGERIAEIVEKIEEREDVLPLIAILAAG